MPECIVIRCNNNVCQRFQRVYSVLPSSNEYIECNFCGKKQPLIPFIDPISKAPLRSYDAVAMGEELKRLKKSMSMHGRPGHVSYDSRSSELDKTKAITSVDVHGQKGTFAKCLVPDDVQPGDVLELRAGARSIQVIVDTVGLAEKGSLD